MVCDLHHALDHFVDGVVDVVERKGCGDLPLFVRDLAR